MSLSCRYIEDNKVDPINNNLLLWVDLEQSDMEEVEA